MKNNQEALDFLIKSKIINEGITLKQLLETAQKLDKTPIKGGSTDMWKVIVKNKFIYMDDETVKVPSDVKK